MMRYSNEPSDRIYVKGYRLLFFPKNMGKTISKNLSGRYNQNLLNG